MRKLETEQPHLNHKYPVIVSVEQIYNILTGHIKHVANVGVRNILNVIFELIEHCVECRL